MSEVVSIGFGLLLANIPSMLCVGGAIWLWHSGINSGPGWLIFAAILMSKTYKSDEEPNKQSVKIEQEKSNG